MPVLLKTLLAAAVVIAAGCAGKEEDPPIEGKIGTVPKERQNLGGNASGRTAPMKPSLD